MESTATYDFTASAEDELSFSKGDTLKILITYSFLNIGEDTNWYKAELNGKEGFVPSNRIEWEIPDWYREIHRNDAEVLLLNRKEDGDYIQPDGAFLVRPSESSPGDFTVSVKFGDQVQHFKILRDGSGKYFLWVVKFDSVNMLVNYHRFSSVSRSQKMYLIDMVEQIYIAMYDFTPQDAEELELREGDHITWDYRNENNWWFGKNQRTGQRGMYPANYVKQL